MSEDPQLMPDQRLEKCRYSYQIVKCDRCGKPTTRFNSGCICGGCEWELEQLAMKEKENEGS